MVTDLSKCMATVLHDLSLGVYHDDMNIGNILLDTSFNYSPTTSSYYTKDVYISVFNDGATKLFDRSFGNISHNSINIQVVGKTSSVVLKKIDSIRLALHCKDFNFVEGGTRYILRCKVTHVAGCFLEPESGWFQSSLSIQCGVWGS